MSTERGKRTWAEIGTWLAFALLCVGACRHAVAHGDWIVDDALITFSYARNLVAGHGLVVNPGESPLEGYSNPLWLGVCALAMQLGVFHVVWFPKIVGGALTLAGMWLSMSVVRSLVGGRLQPLHLLAPALLAVNGSLVAWNMSGLENALTVFCLLLSARLYIRDVRQLDRVPLAPLALVGLALSRPEGLMYVLPFILDAVVRAVRTRRWRWLALGSACLGVPLLLYALWHLQAFEDLLPNTYYAKGKAESLSIPMRLIHFDGSGWQYVLGAFRDWRLWGLLPALAFLGLRMRALVVRGLFPIAAALGGAIFFVLVTGGDWMMQYRLLHPMFPMLAVLATVGLATALGRLDGFVWARSGVRVVAVGLFALTASALPQQLADMTSSPNPTMPYTTALMFVEPFYESAKALDEAHPSIAVSALGAAMWKHPGDVKLIDMAGLGNRSMARARYERAPREQVCEYLFEEHEPILVHLAPYLDEWWHITECPGFVHGYVRYDRPWDGGGPSGLYIRRDRIEAPWSAELTQPAPTGRGIQLHRIAHIRGGDGEEQIEIDFSVLRANSGRPGITVQVVLESGERRSLPVLLLPALPAQALRPGVVYRHRSSVALDGIAEILPPRWPRQPSHARPTAK